LDTWPQFFRISFVAYFILLNPGRHCRQMMGKILFLHSIDKTKVIFRGKAYICSGYFITVLIIQEA
jgi:hypothetical protein